MPTGVFSIDRHATRGIFRELFGVVPAEHVAVGVQAGCDAAGGESAIGVHPVGEPALEQQPRRCPE